MAEFKLSNAIDEKIVTDLRAISTELGETKVAMEALVTSYSKLSAEMAKGLGIKPTDIESLEKKLADMQQTAIKLTETEGELSKMQEQYNELLKQASTVTSEAIKQAKANADIKKKEADAELKLQKAETERLKQQKLLNQEKKNAAVTEEQANEAYKKEVKSIKEASDANRVMRAYVKQLDVSTEEGRKTLQRFNAAIKENENFITRNSDAYIQQKRNIGNYTESIKQAFYELKRGNDVTKNFGIIAGNTGRMMRDQLSGGFREVGAGIGNMIKGWTGAQLVLRGIDAAINAIKSGLDTIIEFQAANSKLAAILGTTSDKIKELRDDALRLGAATKYTASEVTSLQTELAKLGFNQKEIKQSTQSILKFASAVDTDLASASQVAGAALRAFGADASEMTRYVSVMAVATTKSALSFSDLQTGLSTVAPVANAFNFSIEDTVTLLGALKNAGFDASSAATATRNILLNLADSNGELAKALGRPITKLSDLSSALKSLKDKNIDLASALELTDKRSVAAFESFMTQAGSLDALRNSVTGVEKELYDMSETMSNNVAGSIASLKSAWEGLMLTFSNSAGVMKDAIDFLTKGIQEITFQLKSPEDQLKQLENQAIAASENQMIEFGVISERLKQLQTEYEKYTESGMKATEAAVKAKQDMVKALETEINKEKKIYEAEYKKLLAMQKEYDNRSLIEHTLFFEIKNQIRKKEIRDQMTFLSTIASQQYEAEQKLAAVKGAQIGPRETKDTTSLDTDAKKKAADAARKAAEKAAKEREKIQQALNESIVALMEDGLDKEIMQIRDSYTKKMAQFKGNSEAEKQLRLNLSTAMEKEIAKKKQEYELNEALEVANLRKSSAKKDSEEEMNAQLEILRIQYEKQLISVKDNEEKILLVNETYEQAKTNLYEKYAGIRVNKIQEEYSKQSIAFAAAKQLELDALVQAYEQRQITTEEYEARVSEISRDYAKIAIEESISMIEEQLSVETISEQQREKLTEQLSQMKIRLSEQETEIIIDNINKQEEAEKKRLDTLQQVMQYAAQGFEAVASLGNRLFQNQLDELEEQSDALDEAYEKEIARIENLEENGSISTEEAEARKRAAKDKTSREEQKLAKKQEEIEKKQARLAKANAIAQSIINTALGITATISKVGFPAAIPLIAAVGAIGAVQLATIMATPLSAYAKGTDDHPGGLAVVGDGGKREVIVTDGRAYITPDTPTLVDLPKHAKVIPDINMTDLYNFGTDLSGLIRESDKSGTPVINVTNNFHELEVKMDDVIKEMRLSRRMQRKSMSAQAFNNYITSKMG